MSFEPKKSRGKCDSKFWTKTRSSQLIQLFELNRDLWDASSKFYCDRSHKRKLLSEIAIKLQTDTSEVVSKLHNLRCQYNGQLRKIKTRKNELSPHDSYVPRWEFFDALRFLSNAGHQSKTLPNIDLMSAPSGDLSEHCSFDSSRNAPQPTVLSSCSKKKKKNACEKLQNESFMSNSIRLVGTTIDSHQIFGDYVADQLRNMTLEKQKRLKTRIQIAILEVEEVPNSMNATVSPNVTQFTQDISESNESQNKVKQDSYTIINEAELDTIDTDFNYDTYFDPLELEPTKDYNGKRDNEKDHNIGINDLQSLCTNEHGVSIKREMNEETELEPKQEGMPSDIDTIEAKVDENDEEDLLDSVEVTTFVFKGMEYVQMTKDYYLREKRKLLSSLRRFKSIIDNAQFRLNVQLKFSSQSELICDKL